MLGGSGDRTLRIAARLADAVNVARHVDRAVAALAGTGLAITVLDLPAIGRDRDDTWARVERLRGRTAAAAFARAYPRRDRRGPARPLRRAGGPRCDTVFLGPSDLTGPEDVAALAALTAALTRLTYLSSALESPSTRRATISCWICWVPSKMSRILESRAHFSSSSPSL